LVLGEWFEILYGVAAIRSGMPSEPFNRADRNYRSVLSRREDKVWIFRTCLMLI